MDLGVVVPLTGDSHGRVGFWDSPKVVEEDSDSSFLQSNGDEVSSLEDVWGSKIDQEGVGNAAKKLERCSEF